MNPDSTEPIENGLHVNWTQCSETRMPVSCCPTCNRRRRFLARFQDYGWHWTCLACGDQWQDSERLERPCYPGWRQANVTQAKQRWKEYQAKVTVIMEREMTDLF